MDVDIRKGMPDPHVGKEEFRKRFFARFYDPAFTPIRDDLDRAMEIAWKAYEDGRKAPRTRAAGEGFADPNINFRKNGGRRTKRYRRPLPGIKIDLCRRMF